MFQAVADAVPKGGNISTWGSVSPGGIAGVNRFGNLGFTQTGTRALTMKGTGEPVNVPIFTKVSKNSYVVPSASYKSLVVEEPIMSVKDRIADIKNLDRNFRQMYNIAKQTRTSPSGYRWMRDAIDRQKADLHLAKIELEPIISNNNLKQLFNNENYWEIYNYLKNSKSPVLWEVRSEFINTYNDLMKSMPKQEALRTAGQQMRNDLLLLYTENYKQGGKIKSIFNPQQ